MKTSVSNAAYERYWDKLLRIHTCGDDESKTDRHHSPYQPTPYIVLERLAQSGLIRRNDLLVDYGSGKGRVSIFMADRTGCSSVGVEYDPRLCAIAEENAKGRDVRFICTPAENYPVPPEADRFFFFNPFSRAIVDRVVRRIRLSCLDHPREALLIFYFPVFEPAVPDFPGFEPVDRIDVRDLFNSDDDRECILVYRFSDL